jgi:peptide/nickel transport system permease protein
MLTFKKLWDQNKFKVSFLIIVFLLAMAVLSIWMTPYNPDTMDLLALEESPSIAHPFGTDDLGRDVLSRVLAGTRITLSVALIAVFISISIGTIYGAVSGYLGGKIDHLAMRIVDVLLSLPTLFLLLTIQVILKPSIFNVMIVIGATSWMGVARLVRAEFLKQKKMNYVLTQKAYGFSNTKIIFKTILPNAMGPIVVAATLGCAGAIMVESALSFLGLGVQAPMASWGSMLQNAQEYLISSWWLAAFPGLFIFVTVLCFNFMGETIRETISPKEGVS